MSKKSKQNKKNQAKYKKGLAENTGGKTPPSSSSVLRYSSSPDTPPSFLPQEVDSMALIMGCDLSFMPAMKDIPEEFKSDRNPWSKFWGRVFFEGGSAAGIQAKPGVDKSKALRHIKSILCSFAPQHEHKIATCAYLSNEWFM